MNVFVMVGMGAISVTIMPVIGHRVSDCRSPDPADNSADRPANNSAGDCASDASSNCAALVSERELG